MSTSLLQPAWLDDHSRREGRYVMGPLLGHGAMGEVYEAWDIVLARPVALKVLQHLEPAAMVRFMHEAQLHAQLESPNICRIYDVDATGGNPRIALQLIHGPTLEEAAKDLRLDEIVDILILVAEAVHGAHRLNLIHRDLKPSNILLQWNEHGGWVPFICDFGLAMSLDGPAVTQPLAITGTPAYMAPEQVRGDRSLVGPPTDVYGIGSTLYFTLLGRPPCVSTTTAEMLRVKRERGFPAPRSLEPDLPPALEAILLKCLEPAPRDRYPTAVALAAALRQFRATLDPQPMPQSRLRAWTRGRRPALAALVALLCLGGTLPALASYLKHQRARQGELVQTVALEAASLEQSISNERLLPVHDLRPADARTRDRIAFLETQRAAFGPEAEGPLLQALGHAHLLLQDLPRANRELEEAWNAGCRTPEAAFLLAQTQGLSYLAARAEAAFRGRAPGEEAADTLARAESYLQLATRQTLHPRGFAQAWDAYLHAAYAQAAEAAQASLKANPWHLESAALGSRCLSLLAKERSDAGDAAGAEVHYQEALNLAASALAKGQSDEQLHHAYSAAALGLAAAALDRGDLTSSAIEDLERHTDRELILNPDNPEAQSDWLQVRSQKAMRLWRLGQDPRPTLDQALQFYWARTQEPRSVDLRTDHMVLYWLQAEWDFARGEDPGPSLTEALKDAGHATGRFRDFLGDLLNFKARVEMAQDQDPRPTLEAVVTQFEPRSGTPGEYARYETAATAWLTRAEWEMRHQIDPMDSIRQAQAQLQQALLAKPGSASAHALQGICFVLEARTRPAGRKGLMSRARAHLRWSGQLNPDDPQRLRLKELLPGS